MDDMQREHPVAQESSTAGADETRGATTTTLAPGRLLANPRRVRRA